MYLLNHNVDKLILNTIKLLNRLNLLYNRYLYIEYNN